MNAKKFISAALASFVCFSAVSAIPSSAAAEKNYSQAVSEKLDDKNEVFKNTISASNILNYYLMDLDIIEEASLSASRSTESSNVMFKKSKTKKFISELRNVYYGSAKDAQFKYGLANDELIIAYAFTTNSKGNINNLKIVQYFEDDSEALGYGFYLSTENQSSKGLYGSFLDMTDKTCTKVEFTEELSDSFDQLIGVIDSVLLLNTDDTAWKGFDKITGRTCKISYPNSDTLNYTYEEFKINGFKKLGFLYDALGKVMAVYVDGEIFAVEAGTYVYESEFDIPKSFK